MKLITEEVLQSKFLVEEKQGKKEYWIEGIFLQAEKPNRNGRIYPMEILQKEVGRYLKENVSKNRGYGELGHPADPTINLERVSHLVKELKQVGSDFVGKAKVLDTPYGKIVKNLIDEGASLGVSSRGVGSLVKKDNIDYVQEDFYLAAAADIVADPSAPEAFVRGIMENREWVYENGVFKSFEIENFKKKIHKTSSKNLEETITKLFTDFINKL